MADIQLTSKHRITLRPHALKNPLHNIYRNGGTGYWLHITVVTPDSTTVRVRQSLLTRDEKKAKRTRDKLFKDLERRGILEYPEQIPA